MPRQIKALIFDFDGLIIDTEMPDYASWQAVYAEYGQDLPVAMWGQIVGGTGASDFDPHGYLEELSGQSLDREEVWISRRTAYLDTVAEQPILPGVKDYLEGAKERGLKLAVASSSPDNWVSGHLTRLCLIDYFDAIKTADDVARTKPDPELYLAALQALDVAAEEAVVFEDSGNGVRAAKAAGIYTVAVPNGLTAQLTIEGADLSLASLAELSLDELLAQIPD
jgi:HAD superfamily hydrolase (TIGR01509 family)